jgi:hypothetical protein
MGKAALVEPDIDAGAALVKALDNANIDVTSAFWLLSSDGGDWSLYVASPLVDRLGPHAVYSKIRSALERSMLRTIRLDDISAVSPKDRIVHLFHAVVRTNKQQIGRFRITRSVLNGTFIEDAVIYRAA